MPAAPVMLLYDAARLRQVLDALVSNAVKFGGEAPVVEVRVAERPTTVVISVRDQGIGMAVAELPRLFDRFHHVADGDAKGDGLYTASALARLHKGTLSARSKVGEGSVFELELPRGRAV